MNPRLRLGIALWLIGMAGVAAISFTVIPQLLLSAPAEVPVGIVVAASLLQSGLLLAVAVWVGTALSNQLGLRSPVLEAFVSGTGSLEAFKRQLFPALLVGLLVAALLVYLNEAAPPEIQALGTQFHIPLVAKVLYGGITEEILTRWGLMTLLIWLPWRFLQRRSKPPITAYILFGIVTSALLFAVGHLPAVVAMGGGLSGSVITYVMLGNTLPGILFGVLYWRLGLEAAILAHATAHVVSVAVLQIAFNP
jgi:hypothetical protein